MQVSHLAIAKWPARHNATPRLMAHSARRLSSNVLGDFFVDTRCIDCGTCRWMAPETFEHDAAQEYSHVYRQPVDVNQQRRALKALVACPVAAIGTEQRHDVRTVVAAFPDRIAENVYHCGFHSEKSFGAASYLIVRSEGNIMIDSPRFSGRLARAIASLGGVRTMFLTHRDDVADHARFREHFGCERVLHRRDITPSTRAVERKLEGEDIVMDGDLKFVPTPGHTQGSTCLIYRDKYLFSGDHVAFSLPLQRVSAFRSACWYSWPQQIESMRRLATLSFEHILPGHGAPCRFSAPEMRGHMHSLIEWMQAVA